MIMRGLQGLKTSWPRAAAHQYTGPGAPMQEGIASRCGVIQGSYKVKYRLAAIRRVPLAGMRLAFGLLAADQPAVLVLLRLEPVSWIRGRRARS